MSGQLLPVNQIDALPVQTIAGVTEGETFIVGGRVIKHFGPAKLFGNLTMQFIHLPGLVDPYWFFVTPFLNLLGCSMIACELTQTAGSHMAAPFPQLTLWVQQRLGPLDMPPIITQDSFASPAPQLSGMIQMNNASTGFLASNAVGEQQRWLFTYGGNVNANGQQVAFGLDHRFLVLITTGTGTSTNCPTDDNTYSMSAWAT